MGSKVVAASATLVAICSLAPNGRAFANSRFDDELSQVLATTPGKTYTITFQLAHAFTDGENDFSVEFGGDTIFSIVNTAAFPYTLETVTGTATSSSTTLAFFGREAESWYDLDDVSVSATGGPDLVANFGFDLNTPPSGAAPLDWTFTPAIVGSDFFVGPGPVYGAVSDPNSANFGAAGSGTVPEPSTCALMLLGFAGLGLAGWSARGKSALV